MAKTSDSVSVALSPEEAFAAASDLSRFDDWLILHDGWRGDVLVQTNLQLIRDAGFDTTTVVVVTNSQDFPETQLIETGDVAAGSIVATTGRPVEAHAVTNSGARS